MPRTEQQERWGRMPVARKPKRKPTLCEVVTGKTSEELVQEQRDLKAAFLERQARRVA